MRELTASVKKKITNDWAERFPSLGVYRPLHLLRRVGPLLMGICLDRDSGNRAYRPTFHVHNLCVEDSTISLTLWQPVRTARMGSSETIEVRAHDERFRDAADRLEAQSPLRFSGDLRLTDVLSAYRNYIDLTRGTEHERIDMVSLATWAGKNDLAAALVGCSVDEASRWPAVLLDRVGGLDTFRAKLTSIASDRETVIQTCKEQIVALGAEDLPKANLLV